MNRIYAALGLGAIYFPLVVGIANREPLYYKFRNYETQIVETNAAPQSRYKRMTPNSLPEQNGVRKNTLHQHDKIGQNPSRTKDDRRIPLDYSNFSQKSNVYKVVPYNFNPQAQVSLGTFYGPLSHKESKPKSQEGRLEKVVNELSRILSRGPISVNEFGDVALDLLKQVGLFTEEKDPSENWFKKVDANIMLEQKLLTKHVNVLTRLSHFSL